MKKLLPRKTPKKKRVHLEEDVTLLIGTVLTLVKQIKYQDGRLLKILRLLEAPRVHFALGISEQPPRLGDPHIMIALTQTQQATLTLKFTPAKAKPDGIPEWATSDPAIASVTPSADGLSAVVKAAGIGVAAVSVTGDKKHGADVSPFVGSIDVQVNEADVESVEIIAGAPEEQA